MGGSWFGHHTSVRQSAAASQTARFGVHVRAGLKPAEGDDLVQGPDSDGEGACPATQDDIGAIVGALQGRDEATMACPQRGHGGGRQGARLAAGVPNYVC